MIVSYTLAVEEFEEANILLCPHQEQLKVIILPAPNQNEVGTESFKEIMWRSLERGSSPVDWCEGNYRISPQIAEFVNTISNVLFFLLPPMLMHLFREYGRLVNPAIHVIWALLIVVGICSAYFHATLSLAGQLLDELAIFWLFLSAFTMFFPRRFFPSIFKNDRKRLGACVITFAVLGTYFLILHPSLNAFALMTLGIPALILLIEELKR
ncbi:hypothetical protein RUM44_011354 [Polyplax serrata]|uniref:Alkaline ceramidase n=1 Tax=Polyplax serrata TaxID=468196 RepID=A0ABR1APT6_POLSC